MHNFCTSGAIIPPLGGKIFVPGEKFFNTGIFRMKASKYAKLIIKPYVCVNLNKIYRFLFSFFTKKKNWKEYNLEILQKIIWEKMFFFPYIYNSTLLILKSCVLFRENNFHFYLYIRKNAGIVKNFNFPLWNFDTEESLVMVTSY